MPLYEGAANWLPTRGLRAFRVEKIEKNLALLDRLQNFAEFLHGLDPLLPFHIGPMNGREALESGLRLKASVAPGRTTADRPLGRGFLIAFHGAGQCCFKGGERNYSSDAPSRREDRYCVGDIPKEALNNRLKWAESL